MIDAKRCDRTTNNTSIGVMELELIARLESEIGFIEHRASRPRVLCNTCNKRDAHAGHTAQYSQDRLYTFHLVKGQEFIVGGINHVVTAYQMYLAHLFSVSSVYRVDMGLTNTTVRRM